MGVEGPSREGVGNRLLGGKTAAGVPGIARHIRIKQLLGSGADCGGPALEPRGRPTAVALAQRGGGCEQPHGAVGRIFDREARQAVECCAAHRSERLGADRTSEMGSRELTVAVGGLEPAEEYARERLAPRVLELASHARRASECLEAALLALRILTL